MLRPSYSDILEVITQDSEDITIASRYTIVIAAAKRARQLVDHQQPMIDHIEVDKPVSIDQAIDGHIIVLVCPRNGGDAQRHDQRQNGCYQFFHVSYPVCFRFPQVHSF